MSKEMEQAIRNLFFIVFIEMIGTPLGLWLYVFLGHWHIIHLMLGMGYVAAFFKLFDAANIIVKHVKFVSIEKDKEKKK